MYHSKMFALAVSLAVSGGAIAAEKKEYSPYVGEGVETQLFWGDTHVHSSFSMDANTAGNTKLDPSDAYRFAKGEEVTANNGMKAQLNLPLDFLVVSDHAEYMGLLPALRANSPEVMQVPAASDLAKRIQSSDQDVVGAAVMEMIGTLATNKPLIDSDNIKRSIWNRITTMADEANQPGHFTALIGYEWTSMPGGDNLHRVVIYRDGAEKAKSMIPVSAFDGEAPESLWAFMERYEQEQGGQMLAVPHNGNVSNGRMFKNTNFDKQPIDSAYAKRRAKHEPIVEVTQIKGDSETHPLLSPDDEFADFATWDKGNLMLGGIIAKQDEMLRFEYARSALKLGLQQQASLGANAFQFGMIGSTDAHTALATAAEDNYWGKASLLEPGFDRMEQPFFNPQFEGDRTVYAWEQVASGYAAVWATENTREAIFDAMERREVYATTGSRMSVRLFGGYEFTNADVNAPDYVRRGYRKGVPMGGTLAQSKTAPGFLVSASKDPAGANLDRLQMVKGWVDEKGISHEKVYNIAASGKRKVRRNGSVKSVGSTVNTKTASYTNTIGDPQLAVFWQDPDFDAAQQAFYYVRVLEIPVPRWTTHEMDRFGHALPSATPEAIQDRAYTSPIWYQP